MRDPYFIKGPAVISFSGGRTSAYLLWKIMERGLQPDVHVMFANTGKEREETLDFVDECARRFDVPITWLEYRRRFLPKYKNPDRAAVAARARAGREHLYEPPKGRREPGYVVVSYETASRNGEPFDNLIDMGGLPNRQLRTCTAELKIRVIKKHMLKLGYKRWDVVLGLRADEPLRVARKREPPPERWEYVMPLADAGVTLEEVMNFWREAPFDLQLQPHEGNCDICFLKTVAKRARIAQDRPDLLDWWVSAEARTGDHFSRNEPPYARLVRLPVLVDEPQNGIDCDCTD
jgi:3'-phosphoadenosine 5'-phosphosulfate sulfotransferase (PAPS reductase)/FAD synthetase